MLHDPVVRLGLNCARAQGMGEPMNNLGAVLAAVHIMCHPQGLQLSHKKVGDPQCQLR